MNMCEVKTSLLWETHDKSFSFWIFGIFVIYFPRKERGMRLQMHFVKKAETSLIGSKTIFSLVLGKRFFHCALARSACWRWRT